jgi:hypothetical protein
MLNYRLTANKLTNIKTGKGLGILLIKLTDNDYSLH